MKCKLLFIFTVLIISCLQSYQASEMASGISQFKKFTIDLPNTTINYPSMTEENIPVSGSEVTIYNQDGDIVDIIVTDENGFAESVPLREGLYYFQETKAPAGYELDDTIYQFYVGDDVASIQYGGTSDLITANILILVVDELGNPVPDVEYTLIDSNNEEQSVKSDENGNLKIADLTSGVYKLVLNDKSYTSNEESSTFQITENGLETGVPIQLNVDYVPRSIIGSFIKIVAVISGLVISLIAVKKYKYLKGKNEKNINDR